MLTNGGGNGGYAGTTLYASDGQLTGGANTLGVEATINNSNTAGVDGCQPSPSGVDFANGSEMNSLLAHRDANYLYLFISGNLQTNFNKLDLFFDVLPGGQERVRTDNVDVDFNGLNRMGAQQFLGPIDPQDPNCQDPTRARTPLCPCDVTLTGLKFDDGFAADYWVSVTNGNNPVSST